MQFELIIGAAILLFIVVFVAIALLERQHIEDFVPSSGSNPALESPYFNAMNDAARHLGFAPAGMFNQNRSSKMYQARMALWVSPDGHTLLAVGGGKTAGVPIKRTILTTIIEPKIILQTQDEFGTADLSGFTQRQIVMNADLDELVACHSQRVASQPGQKRIFSVGTALSEWQSIRSIRAEQMAQLGLMIFLNREHTICRHSLKGAWLQYYQGLRGQLKEGKAQAERISKRRPGTKG
jgi:hypothetical protein